MVGKKWLSIKRISVIGEIPDIKEFQAWNLREKLDFISYPKPDAPYPNKGKESQLNCELSFSIHCLVIFIIWLLRVLMIMDFTIILTNF